MYFEARCLFGQFVKHLTCMKRGIGTDKMATICKELGAGDFLQWEDFQENAGEKDSKGICWISEENFE